MKHQTKSLPDSWTAEQTKQLGMALTFAYKTQTTYKEPLDLDDRVAGWKFVLEEDYTVEQVLYGIKKYMKANTAMPVPADIYTILNPAEPRVTEAEYVNACKEHASGGYQAFSAASMVIADYKKQNEEEKETFKIECNKIQEIVSGSVKRIV